MPRVLPDPLTSESDLSTGNHLSNERSEDALVGLPQNFGELFGATGGTGRIMVRKALERGYEVMVAARNPSTFPRSHERLRVVQADVVRQRALETAVDGQDAAITSVSVGNALKEGRRTTTLFFGGARNMISAMEGRGVGRLVCLSSSAVEPHPALGIVFGRLVRPLLFKETYVDMSRMEREVGNSGLNWVIVRPSTLTNDPASGRYILGIGRIPKGWRIPRDLSALARR